MLAKLQSFGHSGLFAFAKLNNVASKFGGSAGLLPSHSGRVRVGICDLWSAAEPRQKLRRKRVE